MQHQVSAAIVLTLSLLFAPAAGAAPADQPVAAKHKHATHKRTAPKHVTHQKRHRVRHWRGYGFLPGYVPPEVAEREREWRYWQSQPHFLRPVWPRFYRGRWNGGGFGPCYVYTPIGYMWTCGK